MNGFVAYPSSPSVLGETIGRAAELLRKNSSANLTVNTWEETDVCGRFLTTAILSDIDAADFLVGDVTLLNFNVVYEIGYAIGRGKPILLILNSSIKGNADLTGRVGVFDSIGYEKYSDSARLAKILIEHGKWKNNLLTQPKPAGTPIYLIEAPLKTDLETRIKARVKKSHLGFRSYDPDEQGRMQGPKVIAEIERAVAVVAHLLPAEREDCEVHNLRASFVAGVCAGLGKELLLIQRGTDPVPLDYRDLVDHISKLDDIDSRVSDLAGNVYEITRSRLPELKDRPLRILEKIDIGSSAAENEFETLGDYYVDTDEYRRVTRGGVQMVLARKGGGKTAMFSQIRNAKRRVKANIVLDLLPEGYQLLKLKDQVLSLLKEGSREHLVTAFWEYLLLIETCYKLLDKDRNTFINDHRITATYRSLSAKFGRRGLDTQADFSERLLRLMDQIVHAFGERYAGHREPVALTDNAITELVYKRDVAEMREELFNYLRLKGEVWILFDNIDKGWPATGLESEDLLIVRCLAEALRKYENALRRAQLEAHSVMFLRNDIYERLLNYTPDRGKVSHVLLDWTSSDLLREMLRRRIVRALARSDIAFDVAWATICVPHIGGVESSAYLIERSLMRPRGLLDLFQNCLARAINLGHEKISVEDIKEGEDSYSTELVSNIGFELRDNSPELEDVLYRFVECGPFLTGGELAEKIKCAADLSEFWNVVETLVWFGVLGVNSKAGEETFIYDVQYDVKRMKAIMTNQPLSDTLFHVNKAFWAGLQIRP